MSIARRQKRAFQRAYAKHQHKMLLQHRMNPTVKDISVFDNMPVGESFIKEVDKILEKAVYETTVTSN